MQKPDTGNNEDPAEPDIGRGQLFSYESFSGKSWTYNDDEAYIDLGSSNEKAEECFYRVTFKGNAIEVLQTRVTTTEK